jgi:hypothetical protein
MASSLIDRLAAKDSENGAALAGPTRRGYHDN